MALERERASSFSAPYPYIGFVGRFAPRIYMGARVRVPYAAGSASLDAAICADRRARRGDCQSGPGMAR